MEQYISHVLASFPYTKRTKDNKLEISHNLINNTSKQYYQSAVKFWSLIGQKVFRVRVNAVISVVFMNKPNVMKEKFSPYFNFFLFFISRHRTQNNRFYPSVIMCFENAPQ